MEKRIVTKIFVFISAFTLAGCSSMSMPSFLTPSSSHQAGAYGNSLWQGNTADIWDELQHTSSSRLQAMLNTQGDPVKSGWIQLALISKQNSVDTQKLANELIAWRARNPSHPANSLIPSDSTLTSLANQPPPKQIALLLPQGGTYAAAGQSAREGFLNAYYASGHKTGNVKFYNTNAQAVGAAYQQAVSEGADFVVGPLLKGDVDALISSTSISKTTLALNYTSSSLPSNLYEFGLLAEDEMGQIAERARSSGKSRAIVIAPSSDWGKRVVAQFSNRWESMGGSVQDSWYYNSPQNYTKDIANLMHVDPNVVNKNTPDQDNSKAAVESKRRQDFDVIFLFAPPAPARSIVPLLRYYYASDIPIYATSAVYSGKPNPASDVDLNGVIVCDIPMNMQVARSGSSEVPSDRLYAVGQDAYLLSQTLERLIELPNFPIYGSTGALSLNGQHQIHRRVPCTAIHNGLLG